MRGSTSYRLGWTVAMDHTNPNNPFYDPGFDPVAYVAKIRNTFSHPDEQSDDFIRGAQHAVGAKMREHLHMMHRLIEIEEIRMRGSHPYWIGSGDFVAGEL